ncbi:MAG: (4Fe-4S)-binding protein [Alteromonadaceae bacterium]|nr:MAG: (4Fe-4S)-binding protein [Alteromonadaceae bacterium]
MTFKSSNSSSRIMSRPYIFRHLNKVRWVCLTLVFLMLVLIPLLGIYQHYVSASAYRNLDGSEKLLFDSMHALSSPFTMDPENDLDALKGTTWSGQLFGLKITDPLAIVGQMSAGLEVYWPFVLTGLIPILLTMFFGRFYCGWICPATFLYELNSNFALWLKKIGVYTGDRKFDRRIKYLILLLGIIASTITGTIIFASLYPPAVIGREIYFSIALSGFGGGTLFFMATLLFDIFVSKRGFCRYLCPGGALYSLLGRFRPIRIQRVVETCNDCEKCNAVCEFALNPMRDDFGQECNNCTACIAVCPQDALTFVVSLKDLDNQGPGYCSREYRSNSDERVNEK